MWQEGLIGHKLARQKWRGRYPRGCFWEPNRTAPSRGCDGLGEASLVAGPDHEQISPIFAVEGLSTGAQNGLFRSVVDKSLGRKRPLISLPLL